MDSGYNDTHGNIQQDGFGGQNINVLQSVSVLTIDDLNRIEYKYLILVSFYLYILLAIGLVGNSIIIYLYAFKIPLSAHKCFILCLAFLDITNCCFGITMEILDLRYLYDWMSITVCKIVRFNHTFISTSSGLILVLIAVDRYNLVCKITRKKLTINQATACCVGMILVSLVLAWPAAILHGDKTSTVHGINVTECSIADSYEESDLPFIYHIVQFGVFISATLIISLLYFFIALIIHKINKKKTRIAIYRFQSSDKRNSVTGELTIVNAINSRTVKSPVNKDSESVLCFGIKRWISRDRGFSSNAVRTSIDIDPVLSNCTESSDDFPNSGVKPSTQQHVMNKMHGREQCTRKVTVMMFAISIAFLLSFLPHLTLMVAKAVYNNFTDDFTHTATVTYNIFLRSYFINNVINPIIYGICDRRLQKECKRSLNSLIAQFIKWRS